MHGLISRLTTKPEHRDELARILAVATRNMPGCLGDVIALDKARDAAPRRDMPGVEVAQLRGARALGRLVAACTHAGAPRPSGWAPTMHVPDAGVKHRIRGGRAGSWR